MRPRGPDIRQRRNTRKKRRRDKLDLVVSKGRIPAARPHVELDFGISGIGVIGIGRIERAIPLPLAVLAATTISLAVAMTFFHTAVIVPLLALAGYLIWRAIPYRGNRK